MDPEEVGRRLEEVRREVRERVEEEGAERPTLRTGPEVDDVPAPELESRRQKIEDGEPNLATTPELEEVNRAATITGPIRITSGVPVLGPLIDAVRKLFRPVVQAILDPYLDRQERFNAAAVNHLNRLGRRAERRVRRVEETVLTLESRLQGTLDDYHEALRRRHSLLFGALDQEVLDLQGAVRDLVGATRTEIMELITERSLEVDGRFARIDETFNERVREIERAFDERVDEVDRALRNFQPALDVAEIHGLRNRLEALLERGGRPGSAAGEPSTGAGSVGPDTDAADRLAESVSAGGVESWAELRRWLRGQEYRAFQRSFRGDEEGLRERQREHLERFEGIDGPIADLGCGRGEFVELLVEAGHEAIGVEINRADVEECRRRGLEAVEADLFDWLEERPSGSLGGLFLAQVIEHLPPPDWVRLVELAGDRLRSGGRLVVETINPESLYAMVRAYVTDPTHIRPVHPDLLAFLARRAGFHPVEVEFQAAVPDEERPLPLGLDLDSLGEELAGVVERIDERLRRLDRLCCAPQEYTLMASAVGGRGEDGGASRDEEEGREEEGR